MTLYPCEFSRTSRILNRLPLPTRPFLSMSATCAVHLGCPSKASSMANFIVLWACPLCINVSTSQCQSSYKIASSFCESLNTDNNNLSQLVFLHPIFSCHLLSHHLALWHQCSLLEVIICRDSSESSAVSSSESTSDDKLISLPCSDDFMLEALSGSSLANS